MKEKEIFEKMRNEVMADEMSIDDTKMMINFMLMEKRKSHFPFSLLKDWVIRAAHKHAKVYGLKISTYALVYICATYEAIGLIVVVLGYFKYLNDKNNLGCIDMEALSTRIFPSGFHSKESVSMYYDELKNEKNKSMYSERRYK